VLFYSGAAKARPANPEPGSLHSQLAECFQQSDTKALCPVSVYELEIVDPTPGPSIPLDKEIFLMEAQEQSRPRAGTLLNCWTGRDNNVHFRCELVSPHIVRFLPPYRLELDDIKFPGQEFAFSNFTGWVKLADLEQSDQVRISNLISSALKK